MKSQPPYRDERESLLAENRQLRAELARSRHGRVGRRARVVLVGGLVALDVAASQVLPGMINAPRDASVVAGAALAVLLVALHVGLALRLFRQGG